MGIKAGLFLNLKMFFLPFRESRKKLPDDGEETNLDKSISLVNLILFTNTSVFGEFRQEILLFIHFSQLKTPSCKVSFPRFGVSQNVSYRYHPYVGYANSK